MSDDRGTADRDDESMTTAATTAPSTADRAGRPDDGTDATGTDSERDATGEVLLEARDLRKEFGGLVAVDEASFTVERGTIVGLIGPNGAGKSTTFDLVTGFLAPDKGSVRFHGEAVEGDSPETRARKGMVRTFQITRELTGMRVIDNMRLGAQEHPGEGVVPALFETSDVTDRERTIDERADELLERLDLDHLREEYAGNLSGGQRKLLELGRALMADPDLLLLDEPMAGVNPSLTGDLVAMIRELRDDGMTFLIVEHDIDLIMSLSDKVVGMHDGRVLTTGPPGVVKNDDALLEAYLGGEV